MSAVVRYGLESEVNEAVMIRLEQWHDPGTLSTTAIPTVTNCHSFPY